MFPLQEAATENFSNSNKKISSGGKSFLFNFKTGEFETRDGKITEVEGIEALKIWIQKVLNTEKNMYEVYKNSNYGVSIKDIIASDYPYGFIKSEIEAELNKALLCNDEIKSISNVQFTRDKRNLSVSFKCNTIYGQLESEVEI